MKDERGFSEILMVLISIFAGETREPPPRYSADVAEVR